MQLILRCLILIGLLLALNIKALQPNKPFEQYVLDAWSLEQGLPQITVLAITQDADNYIWVGTQAGIARFDGVSFESFSQEDTPELSGNFTHGLKTDSQGRVWIMNYKGLVRYFEGEFKQIHYIPEGESKPMVLDVHRVTEASDGTIWVATVQGVFRVDGDKLIFFTALSQPIYGIISHNNVIYFGGVGELFVYQNKTLTKLDLPDSYSKAQFKDFVIQKESLLAGTNEGLLLISKSTHEVKAIAQNTLLEQHPIDAMAIDSDNNVWVGAINGLFRLRDNQLVEYVPNDNVHQFQHIQTIFEDREKNLWLGSHRDGLARVWNGRIYRFSEGHGLNEPLVWSVLPAVDENAVWTGTNRGLSILRNGQFEQLVEAKDLPHPVVYTLFQEGDTLWVGSRAGMVFYKNNQIVLSPHDKALSVMQVNAIMRDNKNRILLGTSKGLYHYTENTLTAIKTTEGANVFVRPIKEFSTGKIYVGSQQGLFELVDQQLVPVGTNNGLNDTLDVSSILELSDGGILISTIANGLFIFEQNRWTQLTERDGLPVNETFTLLSDEEGHIWASGYRGVYRVAEKSLIEYVKGNISDLNAYMLLSESGGLIGSQKAFCCNGAGLAKGFFADGELWYPSRDGVVRMRLSDIKLNQVVPNVRIEKIKVEEKWINVKNGEALTLKANERDIVFDFTALSFRDSKSVLFKYRLLGYQDEWQTPDALFQRRVNYTNLAPSKYSFQVQGANNAGVWNPTPAKIEIRILPYFYETFWFYGLVLVSAIFIVYFWHQYRTSSLKQNKIELENKVKQHTEDLEISNLKLQEAVQALEKISQTDQLTGLKNRRYLASQLPADLAHFERQLTTHQPVDSMVFAIADIDHFKNINDTYGHKVGDDVIQKFAQVIKGQIREGDYAVRWGGEEFIIVFRPMPSKMAPEIIERIRAAIENTQFECRENDFITITCSIGFVAYPFFSDNIRGLSWEHSVELADHALYLVKESGRNGWATFKSTEKTPRDKSLLSSIKDNLNKEVKQGRLIKVTSWDVKK